MNKLNILLVDDDGDYRTSLSQFLLMEGFSVKQAASVEEAQEYISLIDFDLILLDIRLNDANNDRDISGFDVAKRAEDKQIPCIIITAYGSIETAERALLSLGAKSLAVGYVLKKDGADAVLKAIRRLFGITLLHISDLHPTIQLDGEAPFDQEQAYTKFLGDVQQQPGLTLNPISALIVSGDISNKCKAESYNSAAQFLDGLAMTLNIPKNRVVLVPGNHDVNRSKAQTTHDSLQSIQAGNTDWFNKFDEYLKFTRHYYDEPAFSLGKLYRLFIFENRIAVVAFNSCIIEGDVKWKCKTCAEKISKEHYSGWLNRHQVEQANEELDIMGWKGVRIAVFHHHVVSDSWQPSLKNCQGDHLLNYQHRDHRLKFTLFEKGFRILLHGHRHKVELRQPPTIGANEPYNLGSGAFWTVNNDDQETANYLLLQLSPLHGKSRILMRKYHNATNDRPGYWGGDGTIQPDGIVPLSSVIIPPV